MDFCNNLHTFRDYLASPVVSLCMRHRQSRFHVTSIKTTSLSCPLPLFTNYILPKIFDTRGYHFLQVNVICIPKQLPLKHVNSPLCQAMPATFKQNSHLVKHNNNYTVCKTCYIENRGQWNQIYNLLFQVQSQPVWLTFYHCCLQRTSGNHHIYCHQPRNTKPLELSLLQNSLWASAIG